MSRKKVRYSLELPEIPNGYYLFGPGYAEDGDMTLVFIRNTDIWGLTTIGMHYPILIRQSKTLLDWANRQQCFIDLIHTFSKYKKFSLTWSKDDIWTLYIYDFAVNVYVKLLEPPIGMRDSLHMKMKNKKWVKND